MRPTDFLRKTYERKGRDAATQAAQDMMQAGAAWIAHVQGQDAALRFLHLLECGITGGEVPPWSEKGNVLRSPWACQRSQARRTQSASSIELG
jgi:hypothetical protein